MKDIELANPFMRMQYFFSWIGFVILGLGVAWLIFLYLVSYGKVTSLDVEPKKKVLNKSWQKFVFIYGSIAFYLGLIFILISLFIK